MRAKNFFFIILFIFSITIFAQEKYASDFDSNQGTVTFQQGMDQPFALMGFWYPAYTYPVVPQGVYFGASAWLGDTLYLQTPTTTGAGQTTIFKYKIGSGWSTGVPMPVGKTGGSLTKCGNKLYYIGGGTTSITTGTTDVYEYTPSTGSWVTKASLPIALSGHSAVCWGDSVIFVIGGPYTGSGTNQNVQVFRPSSNTWVTLTGNLPAGQGRRTFALGISGNKIIMAAGYNTAFLKNVYVGTIGTDATQLTWSAAPDVPTVYTGLSRPGAASYANFFFLVNGERGGAGGYYDTTHVFNFSTNTWVGELNNIPFKRSNIFNQVSTKLVNDTVKIFIPGGYGNVVSSGTGAVTDRFDVAAFTQIIPVELVSFSYSLIGNDVILNWSTASETNNKGFEVQKSLDGKSFTQIGFINGNGTSTNLNQYSFIDNNVSGTVYYRLNQIDFDGTSKLTNIIEVNTNSVVSYILKQNYPNPFNPSTSISYQIPERNFVSLKVIDILGNEVSTIVNEQQDAGMHKISFNASNLASGVYLYQLKVGNFVATKRMLLMK
jgi:hypothetical protein